MTKEEKAAYTKDWAQKNKEKIKNNYKNYYENNKEREKIKSKEKSQTLNGRFGTYKRGAKVREIDFTLTLEEFKSFWQQNCYYCNRSIATVGLDRIDSSIGYSVDNVRSCCSRCNYMKLDSTEEQWYEDMLTILKNKSII